MSNLQQKLASESFFSDDVLLQSTVTGKDRQHALDEHKLQTLQTVIRNKVFPELTIDDFREIIWHQMKFSLGELCKGLRRKTKALNICVPPHFFHIHTCKHVHTKNLRCFRYSYYNWEGCHLVHVIIYNNIAFNFIQFCLSCLLKKNRSLSSLPMSELIHKILITGILSMEYLARRGSINYYFLFPLH